MPAGAGVRPNPTFWGCSTRPLPGAMLEAAATYGGGAGTAPVIAGSGELSVLLLLLSRLQFTAFGFFPASSRGRFPNSNCS